MEKAADFVKSCLNFDGGFGSRPGAESHAGDFFSSEREIKFINVNKYQTFHYLLHTFLKFNVEIARIARI